MSLEQNGSALVSSPELNGFINGQRIRSWNAVDDGLKREIVLFASRSLGVPTSMIRREEIQKPVPELGGKNLNGLYWNFMLDPERGEEDVYVFMNRKLGLTITPEDLI